MNTNLPVVLFRRPSLRSRAGLNPCFGAFGSYPDRRSLEYAALAEALARTPGSSSAAAISSRSFIDGSL